MMLNKNKYVILILSYGRPNSIKTLNTLKRKNCTEDIYIICSKDDVSLSEYHKNNDNVITFDKKEYINKIDMVDNGGNDKVAIYARYAAYDIAEKLGFEYFIVLDDDYTDFMFRFLKSQGNNSQIKYSYKTVANIDDVFGKMVEYYAENKQIQALGISQGGDFIGGKNSNYSKSISAKRKVMNVFILSTKRKISFIGRMNADVNTYVSAGMIGNIMIQLNVVSVQQEITQKQKGGLTDIYLEMGTYNKSFYSIIVAPSCVKIGVNGNKNYRIHHSIDWDACAVKIISDKHKK